MTTALAEREAQHTATPQTTLPVRTGRASSTAHQRKVGGVTRDDLLLLGGALISSLATTSLLFGRITPITGQPGFLVVAFVIFVLVYAVLVSLTETRPVVVDRVMAVLLTSAAAIALLALATVIIYTFVKGWKALVHVNFYTQDLSRTGPSEPLTSGGITHAMVGTLIMTLIALVLTVPLGIASAVFITETRGRLASFVRTVVTAMTALPSILAGLFIFATMILALGFERSVLAASIAISIMMLPIIIRSADVVLRLVPGGLREASAALGAPHWRTVWGVVLPTARSGLTTSVILGVARGVGETAPVLLTAGFTATMNTNPTKGPMVPLPLTSYYLVASGQTNQIIRGFATAAVLMVLVLVLFTAARIIGGKPDGRLSKRQSKAAAARSVRDLPTYRSPKGRGTRMKKRRLIVAIVALLVALGTAVVTVPTASARETFVRISGEGSSWAANAIDAMRVNVRQFGMTVDYNPTGSSAGRKRFLDGTVDFAASDIPFQFDPEDGSAKELPAPGSYAYIPVVAGGTSFMYNLRINGKRVTNLRLSGENVTKIFTSAITQWNDPAIQADNPGIVLPPKKIVPVVRSDGSGSSAQFTKWMISQYPALWTDYCNRSGRAPKCGYTSFYPTVPGMQSQNGDLGVAGYVAQSFAEGAIGYVNYSYAKTAEFPVAKVLNKAGFYTEPTPQNVAVSLLKAKINTNAADPTVYLTQDLEGVYVDADPRTYVLSSYSYFILPTTVAGQFSLDEGKTLGAFAYYAMCQAQQSSASLGYSPMPINLVQASFDQIKKIPGVVVQNIDITQCKNPTFAADGTNLLADTAPQPKACDKSTFASQCPDGTGGLPNLKTAVKAVGGTTGGTSTGGTKTGTKKPTTGGTTTGNGTPTPAGGSLAPGDTTPTGDTVLVTDTVPTNDTVAEQVGSDGGDNGGDSAGLAVGAVIPTSIGADSGWNSSLLLVLLVIALTIGVVIVPALIWRYYARRPT